MSVAALSAVSDSVGTAAEVVEIERHHNAKRLLWKIGKIWARWVHSGEDTRNLPTRVVTRWVRYNATHGPGTTRQPPAARP